MCKVDEKDEAEKDEYRGTNQSDVVPPEHEEPVWDDKGDADENQPEEYFRTPPTVEGMPSDWLTSKTKKLTHSV
jgi:hypothetical protein